MLLGFSGICWDLLGFCYDWLRSVAQSYLRLKLGIRFVQKMENRRFWIKVLVSRRFQPVPTRIFHVEFDFALEHSQILQPDEKIEVQNFRKMFKNEFLQVFDSIFSFQTFPAGSGEISTRRIRICNQKCPNLRARREKLGFKFSKFLNIIFFIFFFSF